MRFASSQSQDFSPLTTHTLPFKSLVTGGMDDARPQAILAGESVVDLIPLLRPCLHPPPRSTP